VGDANLAEVAILLKVGVTAIVLAMIEDDWFAVEVRLHPGRTGASHAPGLPGSLALPTLELADGTTMSALEIQWELLDLARKYTEDRGLACVGGEDDGPEVMRRWETTLSGLEVDPESLSGQLDWVAKRSLVEGYRQRHDLDWSDHRLAAIDLQYHDLRPAKSLFARMGTERLVDEESVVEAMTEPPRDTRAYFRGKCLQRWSSSIAAANWDSMVFDSGPTHCVGCR
jgi:proteasome accessory factor A